MIINVLEMDLDIDARRHIIACLNLNALSITETQIKVSVAAHSRIKRISGDGGCASQTKLKWLMGNENQFF